MPISTFTSLANPSAAVATSLAPAWVRAFSAALSLLTFAAFAADPDCNGYAADGFPKCAAVQISPFGYGACAANSLSHVIGAESHCGTLHAPLNSEGKVIDWVNCVYTRLNGSGPTYAAPPIPWAASGSDPNSSFQCYHTEVVHKFGVEMKGWARYDRHWPRIYVIRQRSATCPSGYQAWGSSQGYPDFCVRPGSQSTPSCQDGEVFNPATNSCEFRTQKQQGQPVCDIEEGVR